MVSIHVSTSGLVEVSDMVTLLEGRIGVKPMKGGSEGDSCSYLPDDTIVVLPNAGSDTSCGFVPVSILSKDFLRVLLFLDDSRRAMPLAKSSIGKVGGAVGS